MCRQSVLTHGLNIDQYNQSVIFSAVVGSVILCNKLDARDQFLKRLIWKGNHEMNKYRQVGCGRSLVGKIL